MNKTFNIKTYGCAMNTADSNSIRNLLTRNGLKEVEKWKEADVIILVTCSIRQQAEDKVSGWGIKAQKEIFKNKTVILTGCMAQRYNRTDDTISEKYKRQLLERFPWITHIINIKEINTLPILLNLDNTELLDTKNINYDENNIYQGLFSISHGCNNFCSYCIVPYARGELINFSKEEILKDIEEFINSGGKLITLLGQNVNSWEDNGETFVDLLKDVAGIKGEFWINFLSSHPKDFSDELIDLITTNEKFLKHCNIAVQSGSDRILKLMNRQYKADDFIRICNKIKEKSAQFRITTDAIVGFPTETDKEFEETLKLMKQCDIEMVYIGKFSPREGTVAEKLDDNVPLNVKKDREKRLRKAVNEIRERKHSQLVGQTLPILMIRQDRGVSYYNHEVITEKNHEPGEIYSLKVNDFSRAGLKA
jgi:tRNA-2-methylthio-N6-dimethylallyladenosine synthase